MVMPSLDNYLGNIVVPDSIASIFKGGLTLHQEHIPLVPWEMKMYPSVLLRTALLS